MRLQSGIRFLVLFLIFGICLSCGVCQSCDGSCKEVSCDDKAQKSDCNGPTVELGYGAGEDKVNPVPEFMYFVPLISPTVVSREGSEDKTQLSKIISREVSRDVNKFRVECEFKMWGDGYHQNTFDHTEMVKWNKGYSEDKKVLKNMLDYIKFDGGGYGKIITEGEIIDGEAVAQKIVVDFSSRDASSPVTIGLYSVRREDGRFDYSTRYDVKVARVDRLMFERTDGVAKLGIKVESVTKNEEDRGLWGRLKGMVANFFISPLAIDKEGNKVMLEFGEALFRGKQTFTFPRSDKLET